MDGTDGGMRWHAPTRNTKSRCRDVRLRCAISSRDVRLRCAISSRDAQYRVEMSDWDAWCQVEIRYQYKPELSFPEKYSQYHQYYKQIALNDLMSTLRLQASCCKRTASSWSFKIMIFTCLCLRESFPEKFSQHHDTTIDIINRYLGMIWWDYKQIAWNDLMSTLRL